jgi:hypothetical protein
MTPDEMDEFESWVAEQEQLQPGGAGDGERVRAQNSTAWQQAAAAAEAAVVVLVVVVVVGNPPTALCTQCLCSSALPAPLRLHHLSLCAVATPPSCSCW